MAVVLTSRFPEITAEIPALVDGALRESAERIEAGAKVRVPVVTGRLREAIHVERRSRTRYEVKGGDSEAWYGHLVEHGTTHSGPRPFLLPAFEEQIVPTVETVTAALRTL